MYPHYIRDIAGLIPCCILKEKQCTGCNRLSTPWKLEAQNVQIAFYSVSDIFYNLRIKEIYILQYIMWIDIKQNLQLFVTNIKHKEYQFKNMTSWHVQSIEINTFFSMLDIESVIHLNIGDWSWISHTSSVSFTATSHHGPQVNCSVYGGCCFSGKITRYCGI